MSSTVDVRSSSQVPASALAPRAEGDALASELGAHLLAAFPRLAPGAPEEWHEPLRPLDVWRVARWTRFDPEKYARTLLASDGTSEALVMGWLPGQSSPIHDHGESFGLSLVLSGAAVEERYDLVEGKLTKVAEMPIGPEDVVFERPGDVHRLRNDGPALLVTMHVYAPRLKDSRTYELPAAETPA